MVALKVPTVFAPLSVCPLTELVVSVPVVLISPTPLWVIEPDAPMAVRLTAPLPAATIVPVIAINPVLLTVTLPPPDWFTPVIVKDVALLVRAMFPLVFVALKLVTALPLPVRLMPPFDLMVRNPETTPVVPTASLIVPTAPVPPSAVRLRALAPAPEVRTLLITMPPVLLMSVVPTTVALVVATGALTVMAPVLLALPIVRPPVVVIARSSVAESSSVLAVVSTPLPRLIALVRVLLLRVTSQLPPVIVPDKAILSAVRLMVLALPLLMILASAVPLFRIKLVALIDRSPPLVIEAMAPLFPVVPPVRVTFPATLSVDVTVRLPLVEILARLPTTL